MQRSDRPRHVERPSDLLDELAHRLRRLAPDHRNPHRFHEEKSEIVREMVELARKVA